MPTISRPARNATLGVALIFALLGTIAAWRNLTAADLPATTDTSVSLRNLPANQWIKYHEERPAGWSRQAHAGIAFDSKRGTLLIFGSDTHGGDWDNAVHEFNPKLKRWDTHQAAAKPETYRSDASGAPIAGTKVLQPWAMHTYDTIEYHPGLDALVVMSTTEHNPGPGPVPGITRQPTWIYDLSKRVWRPFENAGQPTPSFFAGSSAYDERRGVVVAYRYAVWELDIASGSWRRASAESHHEIHHTMAYDQRRGELFVFGDYRATNVVWSYRPGAKIGDAGTWTQHQPKGDPCPPYSTVPVAYDAAAGVFVLVVDNVEPNATTASTYLYDPEADTYKKLRGADLPRVAMNYMMAWDKNNRVAFLVTGVANGNVTVWAMRPQK